LGNPSITGILKLPQCSIITYGDLTDPVLPLRESVGANPAAHTPFSTGFLLNPRGKTALLLRRLDVSARAALDRLSGYEPSWGCPVWPGSH